MSRNVPSAFVSPPTFFIVVSSGTSRTSAYPIGSPVSTATILPWILPAAAAGAGAPNAIAPATSVASANDVQCGRGVRVVRDRRLIRSASGMRKLQCLLGSRAVSRGAGRARGGDGARRAPPPGGWRGGGLGGGGGGGRGGGPPRGGAPALGGFVRGNQSMRTTLPEPCRPFAN